MTIKRIRIPEERVSVLIGTRGKTRKEIEKATGTKIKIDEDVTLQGEALGVIAAENIVIAIGRGFSPQHAMELKNEEVVMDVIELPKDARSLVRIRSRLIGTNGKSRRNIENLTKTNISIYGRTVCIIGKYENTELAKDAVNRLIKGFSHRSVYEYLEHHQKELKQKEDETEQSI